MATIADVAPPAPMLLVWVDGAYLGELVDAWAAGAYSAGAYDPRAHTLLADMTLEAAELEKAAQAADMTGERVAALDWRRMRQDVTREAVTILAGLASGAALDDLAGGGELWT